MPNRSISIPCFPGSGKTGQCDHTPRENKESGCLGSRFPVYGRPYPAYAFIDLSSILAYVPLNNFSLTELSALSV